MSTNRLRKAPIAACLSAIFALTAVAHPCLAATHTVTSCDDSASAAMTAGTLRYEITHAATADTIDLSQLACSTITLQQGQITIAVADLNITASAFARKTVSGNLSSRVFNHTGTGTLDVDYLTLTAGRYQGVIAGGGCLISGGNVSMTGTTVSNCAVNQTSAAVSGDYAQGGGILARKSLTLMHSVVSGNTVNATAAPNSGGTQGGGVFVGQFGGVPATSHLKLKYSTIENNLVLPPPTGTGHYQNWGGGAFVTNGSADVYNSTISDNYAPIGGGLYVEGGGVSAHILIANSTVSGNSARDSGAGGGAGGLHLAGTITIENSTIAFNHGAVGGLRANGPLTMQSSIIADNVSNFQTLSQDLLPSSSAISGANNLVQSVGVTGIPAGVITVTADPMLTPLGDHGGATRTHALNVLSPARGEGNVVANYLTDQRGIGYQRPSIFPDIGAYELQPGDDEIFYGGFDH